MTMTAMWLVVSAALIFLPRESVAQDKAKTAATELEAASRTALKQLTSTVPLARAAAASAHAILVFPKVTKAGLGVGGQYGEGSLLKDGKAVAFYKTTGASFGL